MSEGPWASCDRCKFRVRHYLCRTEWTGLFVCGPCFDPRPPQLDPPIIDPREGAPIANARFDTDATDTRFIADREEAVSAEDL